MDDMYLTKQINRSIKEMEERKKKGGYMYENDKVKLKKQIYEITKDHLETAEIWKFIEDNIYIIYDVIHHGRKN